MGKYSIKDLEHLSGIKAHTIRIWEKRHGIIEPRRSSTNIRSYSDHDLKKIISVSMLNNQGMRISKIADMTNDEINDKVQEIGDQRNHAPMNIDQLLIAMVDLEEELFEKILGSFILRFGFEKTILEVVYPFLQKIGILWQTHAITPAQEHFISNLIRQKLIVAIDGLPIPPKTARKAVLFLPEGEMHEMGLLFYHFQARSNGYRTYYLGQNVPHEDLASIVESHRPDLLITSITSPLLESIERYFKRLATDFPTYTILASGLQVQRYQGHKIGNVQTFQTADQLLGFLL
jgi:MerR family transcriptional regulator, light-induced transcriptional regulator